MDMDNNSRNDWGSRGGEWVGQKRAKGENWDNCNRINNNNKNNFLENVCIYE